MTSGHLGFELRDLRTRSLVYRYNTEPTALAFVRDVVRVSGHEEAARFSLEERDESGETHPVAAGESLVQRTLEDRAG